MHFGISHFLNGGALFAQVEPQYGSPLASPVAAAPQAVNFNLPWAVGMVVLAAVAWGVYSAVRAPERKARDPDAGAIFLLFGGVFFGVQAGTVTHSGNATVWFFFAFICVVASIIVASVKKKT